MRFTYISLFFSQNMNVSRIIKYSWKVNRLIRELMIETLITLGFGRCDAEVYAFLSEKGPQRGRVIAASLNLSHGKLYCTLRKLKRTRIVISSAQHPAVFSSVAFAKVIDQFIEVNRQQARVLQESKEQLVSNWEITKNSPDGSSCY